MTHTHSHEEHRSTAPDRLLCAVLTVSDTRTQENDTSGQLLWSQLEAAGHDVVEHRILKDDPGPLVAAVDELVARGIHAIVLTGGTGITSRDGTYEALSALVDKQIDGFGEIFRYLSYQEIGAAAVMSRAFAGVYRRALIVSLPGSQDACRLALEKLLLPEIRHMVRECRR